MKIMCPLLTAARVVAGKPLRDVIRKMECRGEECAWYVDGKCAVVVLAEKMATRSFLDVAISSLEN